MITGIKDIDDIIYTYVAQMNYADVLLELKYEFLMLNMFKERFIEDIFEEYVDYHHMPIEITNYGSYYNFKTHCFITKIELISLGVKPLNIVFL